MAKVDKKSNSKSKSDKNKKSKSKNATAEVVEIKSKKKLSPLEAARLAKKSGKTKPKAKGKKAIPIWKAPEDFKPHFLEVVIRTEKDGLLASSIKATRYQGKYDPQADDKKKFDLATYDQATLTGIIARLSGVTYKANAEKRYPEAIKERAKTEKVDGKVRLIYRTAMRLPANATFKILLRIGKKAADESLTVGFKSIAQAVKNENGRVKGVELDKKDPVYRAIRKASRILPAAFKAVVAPPKKTRGSKKQKDEDEE